MKRVVITGICAFCAECQNIDEIYQLSLQNGTCIHNSDRFSEIGLNQYPVNEMNVVKDDFEINSIEEKTHVLIKKAIKGAIENADIENDIKKCGEHTGLSIASSTLKVLKMEEYTKRKIAKKKPIPSLVTGDNFLQNICSTFGIQGETYNTSIACASSTVAVGIAYDAIRYGDMKIMIVASADPLTDLSMTGFHILNTLSKDVCKPFDVERDGINLGEAGVALILEDFEYCKKRKAHAYAEIKGYGISNDAYSSTAPDPQGNGAKFVMQQALKQGNIDMNQVGYINAHGTSTIINDQMERKAISDLHAKGYISSTKSLTGHCLATAGAIELALCIEIGRKKIIPPIYGLKNVEETGEKLNIVVSEPAELKTPYILSNSFGFGGNASSVLIKMVEL